MKKTPQKVQSFIYTFKTKYPEAIEDVFSNGHCYWFAHILATRFKGDIWFNPDTVHFAAKIGNRLYDVYGLIENTSDWMSWLDFQSRFSDAVEDVVRTCIKKDR